MLTVLAPAKLNLTLEVLAKRQDGFHEIRSVIQSINLGDSLTFRLNQNVTFKSNMPDWIPEESLVARAAGLLQEVSGDTKGATIEVSKRIPLVSGLGGDSSDAAATLHGLNKLWGLGLSPRELLGLAARLGSDVAFFLYGGTALVTSKGEMVTPLPPLPTIWVVLVVPLVPKLPRKTEQLYARLKTSHYTDGQITERLVEALKTGGGLTPSLLYNTFENVAFTHFPQLGVYRKHMVQVGATNVHLTGSGPTLYTMIKDKAQAGELHIRLQQQGLASYLTETLTTIDQI